jgi:hypothetical protein
MQSYAEKPALALNGDLEGCVGLGAYGTVRENDPDGALSLGDKILIGGENKCSRSSKPLCYSLTNKATRQTGAVSCDPG